MRLRVSALRVALVALFVVVGGVGATAPASAQTTARAVVVVDLGTLGGGVHTSVIEFSGTVSGLEALQLAGASPSTITYGPMGQAVCQLFGAGDAPVPGQCPGGWVYFRAPGGAGGWTQSSLGASNTTVHDGDVEGWRYGGGAPPFQTFCSVVGCAPPPAPETSPPVVTPAGGGTSAIGSPANTPAGDGSATPATGDAGSGSATPTTAASDGAAGGNGANGATVAGAGTGSRQQRVTRALRPATAAASEGGGSPVGVAVVVVVVAALVGGGLLLRRRRAGT